MTKSKLSNNIQKRHFQITVVGSGLTGSLMIYILIKSKIVSKENLCWVTPNTKISNDNRVSFYNYKNYQSLTKFGLKKTLNQKESININKIEVLNQKQNKPLTFRENESLGMI